MLQADPPRAEGRDEAMAPTGREAGSEA
jgi:hypothetical protein